MGLTPATVTQVQTWINNIRAAIPNLISLNKSAKAGLAKMGKKRFAWAKEAFEYAQMFPQVLPQNRSFALFAQVKNDYDTLSPIFKNLSLLHHALGDTMTQLGANYYTHGLDLYGAVNDPTNDDLPGILMVRDDLSTQFATQGLSVEPTETIEETIVNNSDTGSGNVTGTGSGNGNVDDGGSVNV